MKVKPTHSFRRKREAGTNDEIKNMFEGKWGHSHHRIAQWLSAIPLPFLSKLYFYRLSEDYSFYPLLVNTQTLRKIWIILDQPYMPKGATDHKALSAHDKNLSILEKEFF